MNVKDRFNKGKRRFSAFIRWAGMGFNILSREDKRGCVLFFGIAASIFCAMLVFRGITGKSFRKNFTIDSIQQPKDIYMKNDNAISENQLIPVGKFKGEVNGEFEALYLAVDCNGNTFINRSIDYSPDAYTKSNGWQEVTKSELERYQRELHFLPARGKGIKH